MAGGGYDLGGMANLILAIAGLIGSIVTAMLQLHTMARQDSNRKAIDHIHTCLHQSQHNIAQTVATEGTRVSGEIRALSIATPVPPAPKATRAPARPRKRATKR